MVKKITKREIENYLKLRFKNTTKTGRKSSAYSYMNKLENVALQFLAENIDEVIKDYDIGGCKESEGAKSNNTVINSLKALRDFYYEIM